MTRGKTKQAEMPQKRLRHKGKLRDQENYFHCLLFNLEAKLRQKVSFCVLRAMKISFLLSEIDKSIQRLASSYVYLEVEADFNVGSRVS